MTTTVENDGTWTLCGRDEHGDATPKTCAVFMLIWVIACVAIGLGGYLITEDFIIAGAIVTSLGIITCIAPCVVYVVIICCALRGLGH